jgi:electron transfer flavoprotein alpha subunit
MAVFFLEMRECAGMMSLILVATVNPDPDATIFGFSQYGVVGDLFQVIPALTAQIRKRKGKKSPFIPVFSFSPKFQ